MPSRSAETTIIRLPFPVLDRVLDVARVPIAPAGARRRWCREPFEHMEVVEDGRVFLCCPSWQPSSVGNVFDTPLLEIWRSPAAEAIRASIRTDTFRWCESCPMLAGVTGFVRHVDAEPKQDTSRVSILSLAYDRTCNLSCPSCRTTDVVHNSGPMHDYLQRVTERVTPIFPHVDLLSITGSGDPFSSRIYRNLIRGLDPASYPRMRLRLHTNALLFTPATWGALGPARTMVRTVWVSIDAGTAETYAVNRRGGNWHVLQQNLGFIAGLGLAEFRVLFVVQANNWREMPAFISLARKHGATVEFQRIRNWTTFTQDEYNARAVHMPTHPEHQDFLRLVQSLDGGDDVGLGELALGVP